MTEVTPSVISAIAQVMAEVTSVSKDDQFNGGQTRYAYRGVDRVVRALSASMRKHGLVMVPVASAIPEYISVTTSQGKPASMVRILVTYRIYLSATPAQDPLEVTVPGEAMDSGDKAVSKAMSVAWRTALLQTFFLPTEDPDPDSENYELGARPQQVRGGGNPANLAKLAERDAKEEGLVADWLAAVESAAGDRDRLNTLWTDAVAKRVPKQVLEAIRAEGNKLGPVQGG
jgi:ERF superfamily.